MRKATPGSSQMGTEVVSYILYFIILILVAGIIFYYYYVSRLNQKECSFMNGLYSSIDGYIHSVAPTTDADCSGNLRDYYIKTAFNACSGGTYRNDFVDVCNLKAILKQGVRGLDFEIYSVDGEPVVSTSTQSANFYVKETFNSVPFSSVIDTIRNYAFSGGAVPNPSDPLVLHLRIKSEQSDLYGKLADIFKANSDIMLGKEYSYENNGTNMGEVPLAKLLNKVVLIVDKSNPAFLSNRDFMEYVNMTSNSVFMRTYQYNQVKNTPDMNELTEYNKRNMTIVLPDVTTDNPDPPNPSGILCRAMGCQMVAMRYQTIDQFLEENAVFFDNVGYAFALKPEELRYEPVTIPVPTPQNPALSYETRTVTKDYYQFNF
jgi:hypothetical protein